MGVCAIDDVTPDGTQLNVARRLIWRKQEIRPDKTIACDPMPMPGPSQKALPAVAIVGMLDETTAIDLAMKPDLHIPQSLRLLDQLREVLRYRHHSLRTEQAYL